MFFPTASNSWFAFPAVEVALGCKSPHHADGEGQGQTPWFGSSRLGQRGLGYWKQERDSRSLVFQQLPEGLHVHYFYNSSLVLSTWIIQFTVVTDIFNYCRHWLWQSHAPMFNIWFLASHIYPGRLFQFPSHPCHEEEKGLTDNRRGLVLRDWASGWDWLETVPALLSSFYICSMFTLWVCLDSVFCCYVRNMWNALFPSRAKIDGAKAYCMSLPETHVRRPHCHIGAIYCSGMIRNDLV